MNRDEKEMAEWLASPLEFGEMPQTIREIHRETTSWPLFDEQVQLVFHRYRMKDGFQSIGMTGPITWSFLGDDLSGFDIEELKRLYAGWYISFVAINSRGYSEERCEKQRKALEAELKGAGAGFAGVVAYLSFGELIFYAYRQVDANGEQTTIATDTIDRLEYAADSKYLRLPPLYFFLGSLFFQGKL